MKSVLRYFNLTRNGMAGLCVAAAITPPLSGHPREGDAAARAKDYLNQLVNGSESPGVQYALASADSVIFSFTGGAANLASNIPVTDATTFLGFSVTKTFTALAVLQLVQEERLSLDDPISRYLDYFPYERSPTIRQTLNHTGGLPNPIPIAWSHTAEEHRSFNRRGFIREVLMKNGELRANPGEAFAYSNIGYLLLGEVIERASGMSYEDYVMTRIVHPLSLRGIERLSFEIPDGKHPRVRLSGALQRSQPCPRMVSGEGYLHQRRLRPVESVS
jgi:CubicO group peptidase (beta-lactamase class C family)